MQLLDSHSRNSNFSMDRTACWQCCSGPSPSGKDTGHRGGAITSGDPNNQCVSAGPVFAEQFPGKKQLQKPLYSSTSTSLVTPNVPLSWSPAKLSARWQKGKRAGSACINKWLFRRGRQNRRFWLQQNCRFFSSGWGSTALRSISLDCFKDPATVRLEKHPFCHHSNFISRGVIPDKFQTGPNQKSSSENGLYTCYDSYFAASLLMSKQNSQTFLSWFFPLPANGLVLMVTGPEIKRTCLSSQTSNLLRMRSKYSPRKFSKHSRALVSCPADWKNGRIGTRDDT